MWESDMLTVDNDTDKSKEKTRNSQFITFFRDMK